ncbi:unnamed protein product [Lampetra fluviatilis]
MRDHTSASPRISHLQPSPLHHHRHHHLLLLLLLLQLLHPHVGPPILCWAIRPTFTCPTSCSCSSSSGTHSAGSSSSSGVGGVGVSPVHVVDVAGIHVKCSGAGFSSVPEDLPAATSRLLLDANLIAALPPAVLRHLPALRELDLSGNRLEAISPGAFDGAARSLELLDLSANRLRSLRPASLAGLGPAVGMFLHGNPWHCDCELAAALSRVTVLGPGVSCETAERGEHAGRGGDSGVGVREDGGGGGGGGMVARVGFGGGDVERGAGDLGEGAHDHADDDDATMMMMTMMMMCGPPAKTTDVAMLVTMLGWFSVVIGYIICYARQNREEMKKEVAPQLPEGGPGTPFEDDVGSTTL